MLPSARQAEGTHGEGNTNTDSVVKRGLHRGLSLSSILAEPSTATLLSTDTRGCSPILSRLSKKLDVFAPTSPPSDAIHSLVYQLFLSPDVSYTFLHLSFRYAAKKNHTKKINKNNKKKWQRRLRGCACPFFFRSLRFAPHFIIRQKRLKGGGKDRGGV